MEETCHTAGVLVLEDPDMGITDLGQGRGEDSGSGTKTVRINGRGVLKRSELTWSQREEKAPEPSGSGAFWTWLVF